MRPATLRRSLPACIAGLLLAGCGGGGGGSAGSPGPAGWQSGVFQPATTFQDRCLAPRSGTDPVTGKVYPDKAGTLLDELNWLRSWSNDLYLWYSEITDQNPAGYAGTLAYFDVLKTQATTPSGAPKDKFHFSYATADWEALSQTGQQAGYGLQWALLQNRPPRLLLVAYTAPNTPATAPGANLARGAQVLSIDGVDVANGSDTTTLNNGLSPARVGESHTFVVQDQGASGTRVITLVSAAVTMPPVQNVHTIATASGTVGYLQFNDHLARSEQALVSAFATLQAAAVSDLVLDIRYNGGGYLDIASEVAYMIAGPVPTAGQTFELTQFNDKHANVDPGSGKAITPVLFHAATLGFSTTAGQPLPTLALPRVYVLTGPDTCSASEAIINGLRGVGVDVIQVGSTTCGKPYGFYPAPNCGTTWFSIEFRGVNAMDFGDYADGFTPANATPVVGAPLPGCSVADDFAHALGDSGEGRLSAALAYRDTGTCPVPPTGIALAQRAATRAAGEGLLLPSPLRALRLPRP